MGLEKEKTVEDAVPVVDTCIYIYTQYQLLYTRCAWLNELWHLFEGRDVEE